MYSVSPSLFKKIKPNPKQTILVCIKLSKTQQKNSLILQKTESGQRIINTQPFYEWIYERSYI